MSASKKTPTKTSKTSKARLDKIKLELEALTTIGTELLADTPQPTDSLDAAIDLIGRDVLRHTKEALRILKLVRKE